MRITFAILSFVFLLKPLTDAFVLPQHRGGSYRSSSSSVRLNAWKPPCNLLTVRRSLRIVLLLRPTLAVPILQSYSSLLRTRPVVTKSLTAAVLATTGDAVAQYKSNKKSNDDKKPVSYDLRRGLAFLVFGALYTGLFQHFWFQFLNENILDWGERIRLWGPQKIATLSVLTEQADGATIAQHALLGMKSPPTETMLATAKLALNQFGMVPAVYMPLFFAVTGALGGLDLKKSIARGRSLFLPLLRRNYMFWLPVQFFQFLVLPVDWQIPFVCLASLCWTIILSSAGGSTKPKAAPTSASTFETAPVVRRRKMKRW